MPAEISEQLLEVNNKLSDLRGMLRHHNAEAVITLHSTDDCENASILLHYLVSGASWHASYDARVSGTQLNLTYFGNILNTTGEDWNDVTLSLSTARPSNNCEPTDHLKTLTVKMDAKYRSTDFKEYSRLQAQPRPKEMFSLFLDPVDIDMLPSVSNTDAAIVSFGLPKKTIESNNKERRVPIQVMPLEASFEYMITPKISTEAFLKGLSKNCSLSPLLKGPVSLFREGDYVGKTAFPTNISPGENFSLFLGADPSIKVTYSSERHEGKSTGVFSKKAKTDIKTYTTITNHSKKDVQAVLYVQVPKSHQEGLVVKIVEPQTLKQVSEEDQDIDEDAPIVLTPANNLRYKLELKAGAKVDLKSHCELHYPGGNNLVFSEGE